MKCSSIPIRKPIVSTAVELLADGVKEHEAPCRSQVSVTSRQLFNDSRYSLRPFSLSSVPLCWGSWSCCAQGRSGAVGGGAGGSSRLMAAGLQRRAEEMTETKQSAYHSEQIGQTQTWKTSTEGFGCTWEVGERRCHACLGDDSLDVTGVMAGRILASTPSASRWPVMRRGCDSS